MQINLELRNDDVSGSIYPRLKFSTKLLHQQSDVKTEIIRAGNSSYVLLIKNLEPKFGAVLVKVSTNLTTSSKDTEPISDKNLTDTTRKIESKDSNQNLDNGTKNI